MGSNLTIMVSSCPEHSHHVGAGLPHQIGDDGQMQKMPNRIKELRLAAGLTQEQVAEVAKTTPQQISRLEKGDRALRLEWMVRLAPALHVKMSELLPHGGEQSGPVPDVDDLLKSPGAIELLTFWGRLTPAARSLFQAVLKAEGAAALEVSEADDVLQRHDDSPKKVRK